MTIHHGDCLEVMAGMEPESVDAIVTDPPYGLEFMGKEWDKIRPTHGNWNDAKWAGAGLKNRSKTSGGIQAADGLPSLTYDQNRKCRGCGKWKRGSSPCQCDRPDYEPRADYRAQGMQRWHQQWAEAAYRVAKPSAYLLAFGGTRTVHRMTVALEDAGWIIRDMLVWAYASGFPKSKASLKPAWEPIVMARKPGPLRMLAIDLCRIGTDGGTERATNPIHLGRKDMADFTRGNFGVSSIGAGRWPANVILTDPIFDGGVEGVVGGGEAGGGFGVRGSGALGVLNDDGWVPSDEGGVVGYGDSGTYSRFFLVPKSSRSDREPIIEEEHRLHGIASGSDGVVRCIVDGTVIGSRRNVHPTVKPTELMRHLVRLVTPSGGTVLDPFLGSGTTGLACELEGFSWIGIEKEAEYVAIAEARLNGTQRGLGLVG